MNKARHGATRQHREGHEEPKPAVATEAAAATEAVEVVPALIAELQAEVEAKSRLADEYVGRFQRLAADFDNFKRRTQKEKEELSLYGAEQLIRKVLPVLDNLERALAASGDEPALRAGVDLTARQLRDALSQAGVSVIVAQGESFDPDLHMAVAVDSESEAPENTIVDELQKGYKLGDRVLRPSMVRVAKK